ncbi:MAG: ADP-ribosylglycohydrolase family protein [Clostridiaceae bacterium]
MLGAIIGDIAGSRFEFHNYRKKDFELFDSSSYITDDSVMSLAVAKAFIEASKRIEPSIKGSHFGYGFSKLLHETSVKYMQEIGRKYPNCGYGGMFARWMFSDYPLPYESYGNGAAMRISPAGFAARTDAEAISFSNTITSVTHNHKEGMKGAEATSLAIYMARHGYLKSEIRDKIKKDYYPLNFTIDEIRPSYQFNETCQETVPQAIECFLESTSFEDAIRIAVSLGGDSDTIAAITGSIAEAYYGVPDFMRAKALTYLDNDLRKIYEEWEEFIGKDPSRFTVLTKYIGKITSIFSSMDGSEDENEAPPFHLNLGPLINFIHEFEEEVYQFKESHPEYKLTSYGETLEKSSLKGNHKEMSSTEVDYLDAECVLALIMSAVRAEFNHSGTLLQFFLNGSILKWLKRLKDIDGEESPSRLSEVYFEIGGYRGYDTYHLLFSNKKAFLFSEEYMLEVPPHKRYSIEETEELLSDWKNIHTEYWRFEYPQDPHLMICDGTQWSLFVRNEGSLGLIYGGDNHYPENFQALLAFFGIDSDEEERSPDDHIYCSVPYQEDIRRYHNEADDEGIEIEHFEPLDIPLPIDKTKRIIEKNLVTE